MLTKNKKNNIFTISILILSLAILIIGKSLLNSVIVDFNPINGDFQNYNVVRRFLSGQKPFQDFSVYLGLGHMLLGSFLVNIFSIKNPTLEHSVFAFDFLTLLICTTFILIIAFVILKKENYKLALTISNILLFLIIVFSFININFNELSAAGNSARMIRAGAIIICLCYYYLSLFILNKLKGIDRLKKSFIPVEKYFKIISIGVATGGSFSYGNDYGISIAFVATLFVFFHVIFSKQNLKTVIKKLLLFFFTFLISLFIFTTIYTKGNFDLYIENLLYVGKEQRWYFISLKTYYLYEICTDFWILFQLFVSIIYLALLLKNKFSENALKRYGLLAFLNLIAYATANEYKILSGNHFHVIAYFILFTTILFEQINVFKIYFSKSRAKITFYTIYLKVIYIIMLIIICFYFSTIIKMYNSKEYRGAYFENIGYLTKNVEDYQLAINKIKDKNIFSTYATIYETTYNNFQPSGFDYIIHTLGDKNRGKYLEAFYKQNPEYIITTNKENEDWGMWIENANWYFFREIYKNYSLDFSTYNHSFYIRNDLIEYKKNNNINFDIADIKCNYNISNTLKTGKIEVIVPDKDFSGIVELNLDYKINKNNNFKNLFLINNIVVLEYDPSATVGIINLPSEYSGLIPVNIENGSGSINIEILPKDAEIEIDCFKVEISNIFAS